MQGFRHLWLLWLAVGATMCLPPLGASPFLGFTVAAILVAAWIGVNVSPKRVFCWILMSIMEIFFREIGVRNHFKVPPQNVPTLFVCAPHSNQFLDPFVVMHATGRLDLCFLAAAKSMRKKVVGAMARLLDSIPVERPADLAKSGVGTISLSPECISEIAQSFSDCGTSALVNVSLAMLSKHLLR